MNGRYKQKPSETDLVQPHELDEGEWVLVRHENPRKFESKWFGPYQVMEKMMLGTYRLHDPKGRELAALVHGNRLLRAHISSAETLKRLWASPATKDQLRWRNISAEFVGSDDPQNTDLLEKHLFATDDDAVSNDNVQNKVIPATAATVDNPQREWKRKRISNPSKEQELLDCIVVEEPPSQLRRWRWDQWMKFGCFRGRKQSLNGGDCGEDMRSWNATLLCNLITKANLIIIVMQSVLRNPYPYVRRPAERGIQAVSDRTRAPQLVAKDSYETPSTLQ